MKKIETFGEFYSFYLSEHQDRTCRMLHFVGTFLVFVAIFLAMFTGKGYWWILAPVFGYFFAWIGHYFFEKNKPATFSYPLWSLISDFKMFFQLLSGKISFDGSKDQK